MTSKSCIHSYSGISITSFDGKLRPCCKYKTTDDTPTLFDSVSLNNLHETAYYKNLQSQLDSGVFPQGCVSCQRDEQAGIESTRQHTAEHIFQKSSLFVKNTIQDLEIGLDFTCNMMCRMCGASASSKWAQAKSVLYEFDENEIHLDHVYNPKQYSLYKHQFKKVFENTDLTKAVHLRLEGGEPFYSKNLEWFIDKLDREIENKDRFFISIFTNGSIFPSDHLLYKLKKFNLNVTFSLDAVGKLAETIRWGIDWDTIESVVKKWRAVADVCTNITLATSTTVSLLNVNGLKPLIDFCRTYGIVFYAHHLNYPEYLSIYQLPLDLRKRWLIGHDRIDELLSANMQVEPRYDKFLKSVEILDQYQKKSFALNNSEIYNLIVELNEFERQRRVTDGQ